MTGDLLRVTEARSYLAALRLYMSATSLVSIRRLADVTGIPEGTLRRIIERGGITVERAREIVAALRRHAATQHTCSVTDGLLAEMDAAIVRSAAFSQTPEMRFRAHLRARRIRQPSAAIEAARAAGLLPTQDAEEAS